MEGSGQWAWGSTSTAVRGGVGLDGGIVPPRGVLRTLGRSCGVSDVAAVDDVKVWH
jgi:hypothetical protein